MRDKAYEGLSYIFWRIIPAIAALILCGILYLRTETGNLTKSQNPAVGTIRRIVYGAKDFVVLASEKISTPEKDTRPSVRDDLAIIFPNLVSVKNLGSGGFAKVVMVEYKEFASSTYPTNVIAVKIIDIYYKKLWPYYLVQLPLEIQIWRRLSALKHPNIVRFIKNERFNDRIYVSMEFVGAKTLRHHIWQSEGGLPEKTAKNIIHQIVAAVNFLHCQETAHLDLKPENILYAANGNVVKVCDFSTVWCRYTGSKRNLGARGTPGYQSPEQIAGTVDDPQKCDIWALGAIFIEIIVGMPAFSSKVKSIEDCSKGLNSICFDNLCSDELDRLIRQMLSWKPSNRPTAPDILESDWLSQPEISSLSQLLVQMSQLKSRGNKFYADRKYKNALRYHRKAAYLAVPVLDDFDGLEALSAYEYASNSLASCAQCLFQLGQYPKVIEACNYALILDATKEKALFYRGKAYLKQYQCAKAKDDFAAVLMINPKNKIAKMLVREANDGSAGLKKLFNLDAHRFVEVELVSLPKRLDQSYDFRNMGLLCYYLLGDYRTALLLFRNAMNMFTPVDYSDVTEGSKVMEFRADTLTNIAKCFIEITEYSTAIDACNSALVLCGKNQKALFYRGRANFKLRRYEEAKADFMAVVTINPNNKKAKLLVRDAAILTSTVTEKESCRHNC